MKRIAIFCDGTWNLTDLKDRQTNVVQLAQAVRHSAADGTKQIPVYIRGVGTGVGSNWFAQTSDKWLGGALGWGLERNVVDAYKALIWLYEPGDEIHIFGFSRGAYTARSLAGLIRKSGILPRARIDEVGEAMRLYRTRGEEGHPDAEDVQARRADLSPDVATSRHDLRQRDEGAALLNIAYLGVWDTVGALGLPGFLGWVAKMTNGKYAFHDTSLSSSVASARHAVALDERRKHYPPALWGNLGILNEASRVTEEGEILPIDPVRGEAYQQLWFCGDHGSIGGGGEVVGLSAITFGWVAEGAVHAGLEMNPERLAAVEALCDCAVPTMNRRKSALMLRLTRRLMADRKGPGEPGEVHASVIDRIRLGAGATGGAYRPGSLKGVWDRLPGLMPEEAERQTP